MLPCETGPTCCNATLPECQRKRRVGVYGGAGLLDAVWIDWLRRK